MKKFKIYLSLIACLLVVFAFKAEAQILLQIPGIQGDSKIKGYEEWIAIDQFSFGVEREMKESGEKGGTADINIGIGELQECTISKYMDRASIALMQNSINGNSSGTAQIHFLKQASGAQKPTPYLEIKMDRVFVKSYSISSGSDETPMEEVALYYNKIHFTNINPDGKKNKYGWDLVKNMTWNGGR